MIINNDTVLYLDLHINCYMELKLDISWLKWDREKKVCKWVIHLASRGNLTFYFAWNNF